MATAFVAVRPSTARAAATDRVLNPWFGATGFVNPNFATEVAPFITDMTNAGNTAMATAATAVSQESTAVWMTSVAAVNGTGGNPGLLSFLDQALAQQGNDATKPAVVVTIVVYDLPGRDCSATGSATGDWLAPATTAQLGQYENLFVTPLVSDLGRSKYANLRFAMVIEPDALPNVVSNNDANHPNCQAAAPIYEQGVEYLISQLRNGVPNAYTFLDASNSAWLSWNPSGAAAEYNKVVLAAGAMVQPATTYSVIDGFVTNTSNFAPVQEPYYNNQQAVSGSAVNTANFYGGQHDVDELSFIHDLRPQLAAVGFPASTLNFAIDTSRDGWGGPNRPAGASSSTDLNTFVDQSRIDRRLASNDWCNQSGAGLGEEPHGISANPASVAGDLQYIDAFVWVKTPGESDGASNSGTPGYDPMCDPTKPDVFKTTVLTGALPNTPTAGVFNPTQFAQLITNSYPFVGGIDNGLPTTSPTITPPPTGTCTATLVESTPWLNGSGAGAVGGFTATVTIKNTGTTTINGWQAAWTWAGNESVQNAWSTTLKQTSNPNAVAASNMTYNRILAPGASTTFGFVASFTGTNDIPSSISCTANVQSSSDATTAKCSAEYVVSSGWTGGFSAYVKVNNTGDVPINGWTVSWSFANGQKITTFWSAVVTVNGASVTAVNPATYNNSISVGNFTTFGFNGTNQATANSVTGITCSAT